MKDQKFPRRKFLNLLKGATVFSAGLALVPTFLSACKRNQSKATDKNEQINAKNDTITCQTINMSDEQKARRKNLRYTDNTPIKTRTCDNCKLYTLPTSASECGGCTVVPGPIHPKGWCSSWYYRM
ncbi:MAG: high-potential iron-sulfur protein [Myxococcales bacterium]|nr:high-potential iron-sulfur protein [Myxococcales bacterium]USN51872.1 MAG: high-potential iron-sulfur protein [Myxococcales bacterium]